MKVETVVKRLCLNLNKNKCFAIVIGSKKQKLNIKAKLENNPLFCGDVQTKLKDNFIWFGQIFLSGALAESVTATVEAKEGKIQAVCLEIGQIVNDWRSQVVGGIET